MSVPETAQPKSVKVTYGWGRITLF